jgi:hypothetical protein
MLGCLIGSRAMTRPVPGTVHGSASASLYFTWMLSLPTWGSMWIGQPAAYTGQWAMSDRLGHGDL